MQFCRFTYFQQRVYQKVGRNAKYFYRIIIPFEVFSIISKEHYHKSHFWKVIVIFKGKEKFRAIQQLTNGILIILNLKIHIKIKNIISALVL